jgi:hypothetical protein
MRNFALLILLLLTGTAAAEPGEHRFAFAVNSPISWFAAQNVAASGYIGLDEHQAVRLTVASYEYDANLVGQAIGGLVFHADLDGVRHGRLLDVGAGWMYFPRRTFDGPTLELGLMRRAGWSSEIDDNMDPYSVDRNTQLYAVRALGGWSWLIQDRVMISLAAGAGRGYETGTETTARDSLFYPDHMQRSETHDVSQWTTTVEGYFRMGFTFGR